MSTKNSPIPRWSPSSITQYGNCPYRYYVNRVGPRSEREPFIETEALRFGKFFHKQAEKHVQLGAPLRGERGLLKNDEAHAVWLEETLDAVKHMGGDLVNAKTEYDIYFGEGFKVLRDVRDNFDKRIWGVTTVDLVVPVKDDPTKAIVVDYKTGKSYGKPLQADISALAVLMGDKTLSSVTTMFTYFKSDNVIIDTYERSKVVDWSRYILQAIGEIATSHVTDTWDKNQTPLCKWCKVESCEYSESY